MKLFVAAVLLSVVCGALAGCSQRARVAIATDSKGRMAQAVVVQSTGNDALDAEVKAAAIKSFHKQVPVPGKNQRYTQPVIIRPKPEQPVSQ